MFISLLNCKCWNRLMDDVTSAVYQLYRSFDVCWCRLIAIVLGCTQHPFFQVTRTQNWRWRWLWLWIASEYRNWLSKSKSVYNRKKCCIISLFHFLSNDTLILFDHTDKQTHTHNNFKLRVWEETIHWWERSSLLSQIFEIFHTEIIWQHCISFYLCPRVAMMLSPTERYMEMKCWIFQFFFNNR